MVAITTFTSLATLPLLMPLVASLASRVPGIFFGLPLIALASLIFAATHHENPAEIRLAAVHWSVWLGGMLGMVLAAVLLLGWLQ
ncbi:MAG: hypothetical protein WCQ77_02770 [Planctomycetota bacterium]